MERDLLVSELRGNLLGPRGGCTETIASSEGGPDYIVGFLDPSGDVSQEIKDEFIPEHSGRRSDPTDPGDHVIIDSSFEGRPPSSMGISFIVQGAPLEVDICATWSRYTKDRDGDFRREPRRIILDGQGVEGKRSSRLQLEDDVELVLRSRPLSEHRDSCRVSLFLVNRSVAGGSKNELRVYQPQIRVNLSPTCGLRPMNRTVAVDGDDDAESLDFLYRHRAGLARGHLVSAVWASIDPEGFIPEEGGCAFTWIDGDSLDDEQRVRFTHPDIRTEYLPSISVVSPDFDSWPGFSPDPPVLDALEIAESTSAEDLYDGLRPLAEGYARWIRLTQEAKEDWGENAGVMSRHMDACLSALQRLEAGLESLRDDPLIRAAFQFANKSIHQANLWKSGMPFSWRPFQLAFVIENLNSLSDRNHPDRGICDLLWFPTGGGKTEAYLGLAAFTMAYRRLIYPSAEGSDFVPGAGVSVISRYTLRLLTIQQFRRGASLVTSSERLRVLRTEEGLGWRPRGCGLVGDLPWGAISFTIGMWVGSSVTPNNMQSRTISGGEVMYGALRGDNGEPGMLSSRGREAPDDAGEPAQILSCPACSSILSLTPDGLLPEQEIELHLTVKSKPDRESLSSSLDNDANLANAEIRGLEEIGDGAFVLHLAITPSSKIPPVKVNRILWDALSGSMETNRGAYHCFDATRPGYFPLPGVDDYAIICPDPECELNNEVEWKDLTPSGPRPIPEAFIGGASRCPIPALTVDQEIYARCPSMIISTVDKFARLAFKPECGSLFGAIEGHHPRHGYVRDTAGMYGRDGFPLDDMPNRPGWVDLRDTKFVPPDFILQDELHLIDGPLGSIVGLYELAIRELTKEEGDLGAKYIASTATARNAGPQIASLYGLEVAVFPPPAMDIDDSFWARCSELGAGCIPDPSTGLPTPDPMKEDLPGRLYLGLCAIGQSMQWATVVSWSAALQHIHERLVDVEIGEVDQYWTLVGYFNAIRELAAAQAVVGQDVVGRIGYLARRNGTHAREFSAPDVMDLSSRTASVRLPAMLDKLEEVGGVDVVIATSMFGTGVDIDRLGLMFVAGQPKTTSSYIQSTGRVGRSGGGLVVTTLRAGRPRDLNHYEFFSAYHNELYRHVEPVSVQPFSPNAVKRALGAVIVALLRQADSIGGIAVSNLWRTQGAGEQGWIGLGDDADDLKRSVLAVVRAHNNSQPPARRMPDDELESLVLAGIHRWKLLADIHGPELKYNEYTLNRPAQSPVVLGSEGHYLRGLDQVFESGPNSMRDVESTLNFRSREDEF